jgi:hypothetical protein
MVYGSRVGQDKMVVISYNNLIMKIMKEKCNYNEPYFVLLKKIEIEQDWWRVENIDALILLEHICLYLPEELILQTLMQDRVRYIDVRLSDIYRMASIFSISDISSGKVNIDLAYPSIFRIKGDGIIMLHLCTVWKGLPFVNQVILRPRAYAFNKIE